MEWPSDHPAGVNRFLEDLGSALAADGATPPRALVLGPALEHPSWVRPVSHHEARLLPRVLAMAGAARREVRDGADVVVSHFALYTGAALLGGPAVRALPLVIQFHGPWADEARSAGSTSPLAHSLRRRLERWTLRRAEAVVCVSPAFRRLVIESHRIDPWRVQVIHPGVDTTRFTPGDRATARHALGLDPDAFVAVCVRRLVARCGVVELATAWAEDPPGVLAVVGDGPHRPELELIAARAPDHIVVLGEVSDDRLVEAYRAADVSVMPSIALEGFGMVSLESMACGTPAIVADVGGAGIPVRPLDPASVVAPGRPELIIDRIRRATAGEEPFIGRQTALDAAKGWQWSSTAAEHRALYRRLAASVPDPSRSRVVVVAHTSQLGGAEIMLERIASHLASATDPASGAPALHVLVGEDGPLVERLERRGVSVEVLAMPTSSRTARRGELAGTSGGAAGLAAGAYAVTLARRLRQLRPDVVVGWTLKAGLVSLPAARVIRRPLVWMAHDHLDLGQERLGRLATHLLVRGADGIIANAAGTAVTIGIRGDEVRIVNPPGLASPPERTPTDDTAPLRIVMVGRLAPWKGQVEAVEAFAAAFPAEAPGPQATLRIVGTALFGDDAYADELAATIERLEVGDRVSLVGHLYDPSTEMARADIVLHTSTRAEAWGMVVTEAMQCGAAVVATDKGGPAEQIVDGVTGRLVPPGDTAALAQVLRELAADPAARRRLGAAAAEAAAHRTPAATAHAWLVAVADLADLPALARIDT